MFPVDVDAQFSPEKAFIAMRYGDMIDAAHG
jgi:hypothetical protein